MTRRYETNGRRWDVELSRETPHSGVTSVIFRCMSNSSYGWRVVEVPAREYEDEERIDRLSEGELEELFERSQPFDYAHDPKAQQDAIGDSGTG